MLLEFKMRRPHAFAQFPDFPAQDEARSGSFIDETTENGVGAEGVG